jgi:hypothetical protein
MAELSGTGGGGNRTRRPLSATEVVLVVRCLLSVAKKTYKTEGTYKTERS